MAADDLAPPVTEASADAGDDVDDGAPDVDVVDVEVVEVVDVASPDDVDGLQVRVRRLERERDALRERADAEEARSRRLLQVIVELETRNREVEASYNQLKVMRFVRWPRALYGRFRSRSTP